MTHSHSNFRTYQKSKCIFFRKTKEEWGGFSNMAGGYALNVDGVKILTSEALYQACRFPHLPEVQRLIIHQSSPMSAKMVGKPHRTNTRPGWMRNRISIMKWCIRVKLLNHPKQFGELLLSTKDLPIVEWSKKDDFWGAKLYQEEYFTGVNALGRLLMELREEIRSNQGVFFNGLEPLNIEKFNLLGNPIQTQYIVHSDKYQIDSKKDSQLDLLD